MDVKPYDLDQAQDFVRGALTRMENIHAQWRMLEVLYRTGSVETARTYADKPGELFDVLPKAGQTNVNMILPHTNIILSQVVAEDPKHLCTPYGGGELAEKSASVAEAVLGYFWLRSRGTGDLQDATLDMVKLGNGFVKVGWRYAEQERDKTEFEIEEDLAELIALDASQAELEEREPRPEDELVDELSLVTAEVQEDEPYIEYVPPYDMFVSPEAREIEDARWVAQRITLPIDELEANDEFANVDISSDGAVSAKGDKYVAEWRRQAEDAKGPDGNIKALETATVFEFYDMRARRLMVFQVDAEEPLYDEELPYWHRYPPFVHMRNYRSSGSDFWGFGDLEAVAAIQEQLNEFVTEQLQNARRAGNKYFLRDEHATDEVVDALESDMPDAVAKIDLKPGESMQDVIHAVERKALSGDVYAAKADLEGFLRKIMGINDFEAGGMGADRMSATAAAVVDGIASLRAKEKVAQVEEAASQIGNLVLLLCQQHLEQPTPIRVAGPNGVAWPEVDREAIEGEFLVTVEGGSTQSVNPATREQKGMRLLNEVAPALVSMQYSPEPAVRQGLRLLGFDPDTYMVREEQPPEGAPAAGQDTGGVPEGAPADMTEQGGPPTAAQAQAAGTTAI